MREIDREGLRCRSCVDADVIEYFYGKVFWWVSIGEVQEERDDFWWQIKEWVLVHRILVVSREKRRDDLGRVMRVEKKLALGDSTNTSAMQTSNNYRY